jgi:alanine racemase
MPGVENSLKMENKGLRTWIEINKAAAENNYKIFRKLIGKNCLLMAVVKSNAYGHGLVDFSQLMQKMGADWLAVDSIVEASALRKAGIRKNILVLGYTLPEKFNEAAKNNISLTISSPAHLEPIKRLKFSRPLKTHLKIDTGMRRQGFLIGEVPTLTKVFKKTGKNLILEGVYTHFAAAKNPAFPSDTLKQIKIFEDAISIFKSEGFNPLKHASATSGAIIFPQSRYDIVRIGIGLYGLWPSKETEAAFRDKINLKPVLSWKTIVGEIKNAAKGERIGYDFTETFLKPTKVAILPVGYWHGYPRALSSIGRVIIRGKLAKVLGRVSMDMISVDISDIKNAKIGDEVIIIGKDGKNKITADDIADLAGTSSYEIISRLNPLIKRIIC